MDVKITGQRLAEARRSGKQIDLPWQDIDDGHAIAVQEAAFADFGSPSVGWKVGATNPGAQKNFKTDKPFYGPMAEAGLRADGGTVELTETVMAVEPEFAFRMKSNYPAKGRAPSMETLLEAVETCHVALEIIGRCVSNPEWLNAKGLTMEFGGNAAFVVGPELLGWRNIDLAVVTVDGLKDGEIVETNTGANVMGGPINSLMWIAQTLYERDKRLKARDWVSTGTVTAPVKAEKGSTIAGRFGEYGEVSVRFS